MTDDDGDDAQVACDIRAPQATSRELWLVLSEPKKLGILTLNPWRPEY
jgi:hypothetical protein